MVAIRPGTSANLLQRTLLHNYDLFTTGKELPMKHGLQQRQSARACHLQQSKPITSPKRSTFASLQRATSSPVVTHEPANLVAKSTTLPPSPCVPFQRLQQLSVLPQQHIQTSDACRFVARLDHQCRLKRVFRTKTALPKIAVGFVSCLAFGAPHPRSWNVASSQKGIATSNKGITDSR